jgi:hypothetical protein
MKKRGTKQEVFEGLAEKTNGGLKKDDLIKNKRGSIVSKKRSEQGAKQFKNIEGFAKSKKGKKIEIKPENEEKGAGIELKADAIQENKNEELPKIENQVSEIAKEEPVEKPAEPAQESSSSDANIPPIQSSRKPRVAKVKEIKPLENLPVPKKLNKIGS